MKNHWQETQSLHAVGKEAHTNISHVVDILPEGAFQPNINKLEIVTTHTYEPIFGRIDWRNFELF